MKKHNRCMGRQEGRPPRLQDVAEAVGVSAKTVSNAYRAPTQMRPELRARILEAAAGMGYPGPHPVASSLRRRRVGAIGVVYANPLSYAFDDPNANALLAGISSVAEKAGVGILLLPGSTDDDQRAKAVVDALVDGIVVVSVADDDPLLRTVIEGRTPVVIVDQPRPAIVHAMGRTDAPWVGIDDRAAAYAIANHVLAQGHRRVGVVSFALERGERPLLASKHDEEAATLAVTRDRLAGYRDAALAHDLDWASVPVTQGIDSTPAEGHRGAAALLTREPRPTALICLSDRLAQGAIQAVHDLGLRVPDDVSVVGFDDAPGLAEQHDLTTCHQPSRLKGELAAQALLDLTAGRTPRLTAQVPTRLVIRGSTSTHHAAP